jgi:hypothetical protein
VRNLFFNFFMLSARELPFGELLLAQNLSEQEADNVAL